MFNIGQYVSYASCGAGIVTSISDTRYHVKILNSNMDLIVSKDNLKNLRNLISKDKALEIVKLISNSDKTFDKTMSSWNRRYREMLDILRSNDIEQIAAVYLTLRNAKHDLSFGERKVRMAAKELLVSELEIVLGHKVDF